VDCTPLADVDPIPGDPDGAAQLSRRFRALAEGVRSQIARLGAVDGSSVWEGSAARTFRARHRELVPLLEQLATRYAGASDALDAYVPIFGDTQGRARAAVHRARDANVEYWKADKGFKEMEAQTAAAKHTADDWNAAHPGEAPTVPPAWAGPDWKAVSQQHWDEFFAAKNEFGRAVEEYRLAETRCVAALDAADAVALPVRPGSSDERVKQALASIHGALDPGGAGVRHDDLGRIRRTLEGLDEAEADAVLAGLSDAELRRWADQMHESRFKGGLSGDERRQTLNALAATAGLSGLKRLCGQSKWVRDYFHPGFDKTDQGKEGSLYGVEWKTSRQHGFVRGEGEAAGSDHSDVTQGQVGDCYLLASLAAISVADPGAIRRMVQTNPNGTYTVTFHDGGHPVEIVVTPDFPTMANGQMAFAAPGDGGEIWTMTVEKAYAQWKGDYAHIEGGFAERAMEHITGQPADHHGVGGIHDAGKIDQWLHEKRPISLSTKGHDDSLFLDAEQHYVAGHAYSVIGTKGDSVLIENPWGREYPTVEVSMADLHTFFDGVDVGSPP